MKSRSAIFILIVTLSLVLSPFLIYHASSTKASADIGTYARRGDTNSSLVKADGGSFLLVGGQNGTWFEPGQSPRLYGIDLRSNSTVKLTPVNSEGTVWGGGFNGSQALISGWGTDDNSSGPYVCLYNGVDALTHRSLDYYGEASSWEGGDVFAASYNGKEWLLSGLGSGPLPPNDSPSNHMSLGTFNGTVFSDLSEVVPNQRDAILYANAWNGQYWLVGGGYRGFGTIFTFDGNTIVDLTAQAKQTVTKFASVQSIGWNGAYWLVGGIGFLARYDGRNFTDLTSQLKDTLSTKNFYSVTAIGWNGQSWLIGGGTPIALLTRNHAWFAIYSMSKFVDLSSALPSYVSNATVPSTILTITPANHMWILGGYSGNQGILFAYNDAYVRDYSSLVKDMTYINWVSGLQETT
jgi:hypothetical protein